MTADGLTAQLLGLTACRAVWLVVRGSVRASCVVLCAVRCSPSSQYPETSKNKKNGRRSDNSLILFLVSGFGLVT